MAPPTSPPTTGRRSRRSRSIPPTPTRPTRSRARSRWRTSTRTVAYLRVAFTDDEGGEEVTDPIPVAPKYTLAPLRDIRVRVGRDLTDDESAQVELMGRQATITIYALIPKPSSDPDGDTFDYLNTVAVEMVARTFANPDDLQSRSESIGSYSYTSRYNRNAPGMVLTKPEELTIAQVVFGANSASVKVCSQADEYADNIWWPYLLWYGYLPETESTPMAVWK